MRFTFAFSIALVALTSFAGCSGCSSETGKLNGHTDAGTSSSPDSAVVAVDGSTTIDASVNTDATMANPDAAAPDAAIPQVPCSNRPYTKLAVTEHNFGGCRPVAGINWMASGGMGEGTLAAFSYGCGPGTPADRMYVQIEDFNGEPKPATTLTRFQASNFNAIVPLLGDRGVVREFVLLGTTRDYNCDPNPQTRRPDPLLCNTYAMRVGVNGGVALEPAVILKKDSWHTGGFFAIQARQGQIVRDELVVTFMNDANSDIRIRSYLPDGSPGIIDTMLDAWTPVEHIPTEAINGVRGTAVGEEIFWIFGSSSRGLVMAVTDMAGAFRRGSYGLRPGAATPMIEQSILIRDSVVYVLYNEASAQIGRWTIEGRPLGNPIVLDRGRGGAAAVMAISQDGTTLFILVRHDPDKVTFFTRIDLRTWRVIEDASPMRASDSIGVAALPNGNVLIGGGNYEDGTIRTAVYGCQPQ